MTHVSNIYKLAIYISDIYFTFTDTIVYWPMSKISLLQLLACVLLLLSTIVHNYQRKIDERTTKPSKRVYKKRDEPAFLQAQIRLMGINHQRNRTRFPPNPSLDATPPISNVSSCIAAASAAAFYEHRCLLWDFVGMLVHPRAHQRSSPSVSLTQLAFDHDWWAAGWVQAQKLLLAETIN